MKTQIRVLGAAILLLITGCSGSSKDDEETTGVFLDSPVAGISYRTQSIAGVTDAAGQFRFVPGETVTFSVGGIMLPPVTAAPEVTPADIAGVAETEAAITGSPTATNILRFLQTLDEDGNPDNGIVIDPDAITDAAGETLDFSAAPAVFKTAFDDIFDTPLIPVDQAVAHFLRQIIPLAGDWRISQLVLGFDAGQMPIYGDSYWEKADLNIALNGSFDFASEESNGATDSGCTTGDTCQFSLALLDETGELRLQGVPTFFAAIDSGKTVFGLVDIDDEVGGGETLGIAVRRSDIIGYAQSDLAGTWRSFRLTVSDDGTEHYSERNVLPVASNGTFSGATSTETDNAGNPTTSTGGSGTLQLDSTDPDAGTVTAMGVAEFEGVLDAGKTVISFVDTDTVIGDAEQAGLMVKQGVDYETSDLRGIWRSFGLVVTEGGAENYQYRGEYCVENDGNFTESFFESGGDSEIGNQDRFIINSVTGEVSVPSVPSNMTFRGAMDAGKTVIGYVDYDDEPGVNGLEVGVLVKTNFLPITFTCP